MKVQEGALKLLGSHGNFSFVKTKDGYLWKEKTKISKERRLTDEAYAPQRDQNAEFSRAGKAVKLLRTAFKEQVKNAKDARLSPRAVKLMLKVIKTDPVHGRGLRTVEAGNMQMLEQLQFNVRAVLSDVLSVDYSAAIDRATGNCSFNVPAFTPKQRLRMPDRATHYRIVCAGSEVDFANGTFVTDAAESGLLPVDDIVTAPLVLSCSLPANSTLPLLLVAGIEFVEKVNTFEYPIIGGDSNALCLVKIDPA